MLHRVQTFARKLLQRKRVAQELDEELQFHLDRQTQANLTRGMTPGQARRAALCALGGVEQTKEAVRDQRWTWIDSVWRDACYATRLLVRSPAFAALGIVVIALGIGLNTAIFSVVNAVLFRPLPVQAPHELVYLYYTSPRMGLAPFVGYRDCEFFRTNGQAFSGVAAHWGLRMRVAADGEAKSVAGERVSANYFDVLSVKATLGRTFLPQEDEPSTTERAAVISHDLWTRQFERDPAIIGKKVRVNDDEFTIVGVIGPEFHGVTDPWTPTHIWVTFVQAASDYRSYGVGAIARLKPGVSLKQAQAIVATEGQRILDRSGLRFAVLPSNRIRLPFDPNGKVVPERLAAALVSVVALVLLIAAANIGGLLMARGVTRTDEMAIRVALGAPRRRVFRQLLTETLVLAFGGGALGLFVAWWLLRLFNVFTPDRFVLDVPIDGRVLAFATALCVGTGLLAGLAPALQGAKVNVMSALGAGTVATRRTRVRLRHWSVIPQIALSLVLLVVAGALVQSLIRTESRGFGYDIDRPLVLDVALGTPAALRSAGADAKALALLAGQAAERTRVFYQRLLERIANVPGSPDAALVDSLPTFSGTHGPGNVIAQGESPDETTPKNPTSRAVVSPNYFRTMNMQVVQGRDFDERDGPSSPRVAIVSAGLARRLWPGRDAIGRPVAFPPAIGARVEWLQVVGVVSDVSPILAQGEPTPFVYVPAGQQWRVDSRTIVVRGQMDPVRLASLVKQAVASADLDAQVYRARSMRQVVAELLYPRRMAAAILAVSGLLGLLLASVGLYGVISYSVGQRMREVGIRAALGAERGDLLRLILADGFSVAGIGLVLGAILTAGVLRVASNLVVQMPSLDGATALVVPAFLVAVILLACYIPARRAARVDPMVVLRDL
jgi:putative ABC transport system permease protein